MDKKSTASNAGSVENAPEPARQRQSGSLKDKRKEENRKDFERQTGGRDDAGEDEDLSGGGRGVESP